MLGRGPGGAAIVEQSEHGGAAPGQTRGVGPGPHQLAVELGHLGAELPGGELQIVVEQLDQIVRGEGGG